MNQVTETAPEEAAALAHLESLIEPEVGPEPMPEDAQPQPMDPAESLAGLLRLVSMAAAMAKMERTAAVWNDETCGEFARRAVPVLQKYAWGLRVIEFLQTGSGVEEIALLMFVVPVGLATAQAARDDLKPKAQAQEQTEEAADGNG